MNLTLSLESPGNEPEDVMVEVEATHHVGELAAALSQYVGRRRTDSLSILRNGRWERINFDDQVESAGIISGDRIALGDTKNSGRHATSAVVRLAVTSGPDAGRSFDLGIGAHSVGRSSNCTVRLSDPLVSRQHAVIEVQGPNSVELFPKPDAGNPPRLEGQLVDHHVALHPGHVIQIGATRLRLREPIRVERRPGGLFGRMPFHRTPYFRKPIPAQTIESFGDLPTKPKPRKFQFLASLSPLVMGVGMALMLGSMRYLMFAIFSPIMAAFTWWDQRRTGGKEYDEKVIEFGHQCEQRKTDITAALGIERACRLENNPDIELLARRVDSRHNELWQRDRKAPDFLSLRVGVGRGESNVTVATERNGDPEFRARIEEINANAEMMVDVPIPVSLSEIGTIGLVGRPDEIDDLAAALIIQACCLHSPEDVVVMAAVSRERNLADWMKWLPHCQASSSPLAGEHLVTDADGTDTLLRDLAKIAEARAAASGDRQIDRRWPWLLVTIDRTLEPDASVVSRLLDLGAEVGISVIWLTDSSSRVPRQAEAEVLCRPLQSDDMSEVHFTDPERTTIELDPERTCTDVATTIARSLAPMSDATATTNAVTSIPRMVPLFGALGVSSMTPEWIAEQWATDRGYSLVAPIGMTDTGPLELNLVEHGPHGLIGGTSGAGKSELVQSLVVNLAAFNSPERINFLFVDYKGGALSEMFKDIPHTVGAVTNLDALLALRALTSLTAELDRRMELFKGRAPDIKDMIAKFPDEAPPSLVIVVDEFAALVRELPDFVDGIVSIAERGRSLGIHLLMSTQRPSGAINDNIQQNTNLRIALRMLDSGESNNVIGAPDAALIPAPLKGRGLARLGPGELISFQSAWSGAPLLAAEGPPPVTIARFGDAPEYGPDRQPVRYGAGSTGSADPERTQLDATVEAIIAAADQLGVSPGRPPWKETLPDNIPLAELLEDPRSVAGDVRGRRITIGMIDDPEAQDQYPAHLDFAESGAAVIFGNSGSGKSTVLKTIAASAAWRDSQAGGGGLTIFALDFASRQLGLLARFPQTAAVATGDNMEGVTRVLANIALQLERRRAALADATANGQSAPEFTRILLLIDGYENFVQLFESSSGRNLHTWVELANNIIGEGRQYGIDVAFTAGRRGAVRSSLMSSITNRFILRQADDSGYVELGVPSKLSKGLELAPGQGFNETNKSLRFATVTGAPGAPPAEDEQSAMIEFAAALTGAVAPELMTQPLPIEVPSLESPVEKPNLVRIGLADRSLAPVDLDLTFNNVAVIGPPRSGRSTVLCAVAERTAATGREVWAVGPASSPLKELSCLENGGFGRLGDILPILEEMATAIESFPNVDRILLFDDADQYDDRSMNDATESIIEAGIRIVGSVGGLRGYGSNPIYAELKAARTQMVLCPEGAREVQEIVGVAPDLRPGLPTPPGRAVLVADRMATVMQCSSHEIEAFATEVVAPTNDLTMMPAGDAAPPDDGGVVVWDLRDEPVPNALPTDFEVVLGTGTRRPLDRPLIVGRRPTPVPGCETLAVQDRYLSSRHLTIQIAQGQVWVSDDGSRNGTLLRLADGTVNRLDARVPIPIPAGSQLVAGHQTLAVHPVCAQSVTT